MNYTFETDYKTILNKIDHIDPIEYAKTRNYVDGSVSYLSPYISRGVISTKQILNTLVKKGYKIKEIESFVKELCWRDYFQRVAQEKDLTIEIKNVQSPILNYSIPANFLKAATGIDGIDQAIQQLYKYGYMHNHCRMYTASIICNIARSHWLHPAQWMYYHLIDGDWASNACSWQWVAGANSSKKYYANQENINKYTHTDQVNTYLDLSYEMIEKMELPDQLKKTENFFFEFDLPNSNGIDIKTNQPTFIYNYYNLDPLWHLGETGNRILLLEPDFFATYPISNNCIRFMLQLAENIPSIQVYKGSFESLSKKYQLENIYFKEHPLNMNYSGTQEKRDWISDQVTGYYPSFFAYWKQIEKQLNSQS